MPILSYFYHFFIFGPFLLILNNKKIQNLKIYILKIWKIGPKNADFGLFFTKTEFDGQNDHSIFKPLLCLKFLQKFRKK